MKFKEVDEDGEGCRGLDVWGVAEVPGFVQFRAEELVGGLMEACSSSQGAKGQRWALLCVTATGPEGTAWSCVRGGRWGWGKGSAPHGGGHGTGAQGCGRGPQCWRSRGVRTVLSDTWSDFLVVFCEAWSWVRWSWWVPSNSECSLILWFFPWHLWAGLVCLCMWDKTAHPLLAAGPDKTGAHVRCS